MSSRLGRYAVIVLLLASGLMLLLAGFQPILSQQQPCPTVTVTVAYYYVSTVMRSTTTTRSYINITITTTTTTSISTTSFTQTTSITATTATTPERVKSLYDCSGDLSGLPFFCLWVVLSMPVGQTLSAVGAGVGLAAGVGLTYFWRRRRPA